MTSVPYDALLIVSFGGPERREDVLPFLENVLRGKNVPRERLLEVAGHYEHFNGVSPINAQVRSLMTALQAELAAHQIPLPLYWGNRNWDPFLPATLREMQQAGVRRALAYFTSAYSSYSGCRQYRENLQAAQEQVGPNAPQVEKLRAFFNHPLFIAASGARIRDTLRDLTPTEWSETRFVFTAHSIPLSMARTCQYAAQLQETARLVAAELELPSSRWDLVYQSRSGRPEDPWLAPDILDHLRTVAAAGVRRVVVCPIGFLSDHMEVLYDLDYEARQLADQLGLHMLRAGTVGDHPLFVRMIRELITERLSGTPQRTAIGNLPASHDVCPLDCCPAPVRPGRPAAAAHSSPPNV